MSRAPVYYDSRQQYDWNTTSDDDYQADVSRTERMPRGVQYPEVYKVFNNKIIYEEELPRKEHIHKDHKKRVQVIETIEEDTNPKGQVYEEIIEETVDSEADGYIQQKHKSFEMSKWKTFKM